MDTSIKLNNYRGIAPAYVVVVLEGDGSTERPYENVRYVLGHARVGGLDRLVTLGKITKLTENEKAAFSQNNEL